MDKISEVTALVIDINKMKMLAGSLNIANSGSVSNSYGNVYKELVVDVSTSSSAIQGFVTGNNTATDILDVKFRTNDQVSKRYEPSSSFADSDGYVYASKIDHTGQMLEVQESKRMYEAALKIYQMNTDMKHSILKLGK
jgi:flagellar basal body rod protein FlgC